MNAARKVLVGFLVTVGLWALVACGSSKVQQAESALKDGKTDEALALYAEVIDDGKESKDDTAALAGRAGIYITQEKWQEALADLDIVVAAEPNNYTALENRGTANLKLGNFAAAISDLKASLQGDINAASTDIEKQKNLLDAYRDLGSQLGKLGDYDGAIENYTQALEYAEDDETKADIYADLGFNQSEKGTDPQASLDYLNQAIALDPNLAIAYAYRSSVNDELGDPEASLQDANKALELGTDLPVATRSSLLHARALVYLNQSDYAACIQDATDSIDLVLADNPESTARTYNIRASCYLYKEDYDAALEDVNQAIKLGTTDIAALPDFYGKRARVHLKMKNLTEALVDANAAVELDSTSPSLFNLRGDVYYEQKAYDMAQADYEAAIALDATNAFYHSNLGLALQNQDMLVEAVEAFTAAIELDGSDIYSWYQRGVNNFYLENTSEARADFETALTLNPEDWMVEEIQGYLSELPE